MQQWLQEGYVDFLEIYSGFSELTFQVRGVGLRAGEGLDNAFPAYGRPWPLEESRTQRVAAWLIAACLRPLATHTGTPCTDMCRIGSRMMTPETVQLVRFAVRVAKHQLQQGYLASNENPVGSTLFEQKEWKAAFGTPEEPRTPWFFHQVDGCQLGMESPDVTCLGCPMLKSQYWMANFDLTPIALRCRAPLRAVMGASHEHQQIRGSVKTQYGSWISLAKFSGRLVMRSVWQSRWTGLNDE